MSLKYYLIDNPVTEDPDDFRAQVSGYDSVTETQIFDYITRKGSTITPAEAKANYQELIEAHHYFLKQGYGINTEFINAQPVIKGVFTSKNDRFDPSRHKIGFKVRFGKYYAQTASDVSAEKVTATITDPQPVELEDITSGEINGNITPGGTAMLEGLRMKFDREDTAQGIFFVDQSGVETRADKIVTLRAAEIVFVVPAGLASGNYSLEVRTLTRGNKNLKRGLLKDKLNVV